MRARAGGNERLLMAVGRVPLTPERRAALRAERRRLFEQLRARLNDPRRAGISHADFMKLSDGGRIRVPESAGVLTASAGGFVSADDVFDVNVARSVVYVMTEELIAELANSGDLPDLSDEALEEQATRRCLEAGGVRAAFERFPDTLGSAIRLSVLRLRHRSSWRVGLPPLAGTGLSDDPTHHSIDECDNANSGADDRRSNPTSRSRSDAESPRRRAYGATPSSTETPPIQIARPSMLELEAFGKRYAESLAKSLAQLARRSIKR